MVPRSNSERFGKAFRVGEAKAPAQLPPSAPSIPRGTAADTSDWLRRRRAYSTAPAFPVEPGSFRTRLAGSALFPAALGGPWTFVASLPGSRRPDRGRLRRAGWEGPSAASMEEDAPRIRRRVSVRKRNRLSVYHRFASQVEAELKPSAQEKEGEDEEEMVAGCRRRKTLSPPLAQVPVAPRGRDPRPVANLGVMLGPRPGPPLLHGPCTCRGRGGHSGAGHFHC